VSIHRVPIVDSSIRPMLSSTQRPMRRIIQCARPKVRVRNSFIITGFS